MTAGRRGLCEVELNLTMNIVELLTRYPIRVRFDAAENRLTAVLAAALTQAESLRADVIADLWHRTGVLSTSPESHGSAVAIHKPVFPPGRDACFLDMELEAAGGGTRIWIEAKLQSPLSGGDQLTKYADALRTQSAQHKLLVLLAPARRRRELERHLPRGHKVPSVFASWSDMHRILDNWCRSAGSNSRRRWLVQEAMAYMDEQGQGST